jgi:hypothetical protein
MIQISIKNGRDRFWQWDANQHLVIRGVPDTFHVHFMQEGHAEPLPVLPVKQADGSFLAPVPNILLQTDEDVIVYVYYTTADEQYTKTFKRFYVVPREKPAEYIYTETQLVTWEGMTQQCEGTLREATNILAIADACAENAKEDAEKAQEASEAAAGKVVEAEEQAAKAANSAQSAAATEQAVREYGENVTKALQEYGKTVTEAVEDISKDIAENAQTSVAATGQAIDAAERAEAATEMHAGVIALDAAGATVTLPDSAERPLRALTGDITATQSGSGDPAPDNVRPINGWSGVTVTVQNEGGSATHSVDFGREVYGGRYDWRTGELTVTHKKINFAGLGWHEVNLEPADSRNWVSVYAMRNTNNINWKGDTLIRSNVAKSMTWDDLTYGRYTKLDAPIMWYAATSWGYALPLDLIGLDTSATNDEIITAATAYLTGLGAYEVLEVATPEVVQLEPSALPSTLYPSTTIFADTGDVTLTYAADTKNYIDRRILDLIGAE